MILITEDSRNEVGQQPAVTLVPSMSLRGRNRSRYLALGIITPIPAATSIAPLLPTLELRRSNLATMPQQQTSTASAVPRAMASGPHRHAPVRSWPDPQRQDQNNTAVVPVVIERLTNSSMDTELRRSALSAMRESRAATEERIAARRARVDAAVGRARGELQAINSLARSRLSEVIRERETMLSILREINASHTELLRQYRVLASLAAAAEEAKPAGVPNEDLQNISPELLYGTVLAGSRDHELPGDGECAICQNAIARTESVRLLPCKHCFHSCCIDPWFERSTQCPTCRGIVC